MAQGSQLGTSSDCPIPLEQQQPSSQQCSDLSVEQNSLNSLGGGKFQVHNEGLFK